MLIFFFKQKTAYEMRISDWSSDVCSSDLRGAHPGDVPRLEGALPYRRRLPLRRRAADAGGGPRAFGQRAAAVAGRALRGPRHGGHAGALPGLRSAPPPPARSEEHTSELQSLMRTSYAVFCLKTQRYKYN